METTFEDFMTRRYAEAEEFACNVTREQEGIARDAWECATEAERSKWKRRSDAATAAIKFALYYGTEESIPFLQCWSHGEFDVIRREWPEAPEEVFIGADPLHPLTTIAE